MAWFAVFVASWILLGLPAFALATFAARRLDCADWATVCWGLAAVGLVSMAAFWATFAAPALGTAFAVVTPVLSIAYLVAERLRRRGPWPGKPLVVPLLIAMSQSALVLALGLIHGTTGEPTKTALSRFSHLLPTDNRIPIDFARFVAASGHGQGPFGFGDWLSSDRPPLGTGFVLSQWPLVSAFPDSDLAYIVVAASLQSLMLVAVWAFLAGVAVSPRARALTTFAVATALWAYVNTFFTWPKELGVVFLAPAAVIALAQPRLLRRHVLLVSVSSALAVMTHGTAVFALVGFAALAVLRGGYWRASWRRVVVGGVAFAGITLPWLAYQKLFDPPGDRLLKWQFAGAIPVDSRTFPQALVDGYREVGLAGALENRWVNLVGLLGRPFGYDVVPPPGFNPIESMILFIRYESFYALVPTLSLLWLVLPWAAWALFRGTGHTDVIARRLMGALGLIVAFWIAVIFSDQALLHVGTLMMPILLTAALVVSGFRVRPRATAVVVALTAAVNLLVMFPRFTPGSADVSWQVTSAFSLVVVVGAVIGLTLLTWLDGRSARAARSRSQPAMGRHRGPSPRRADAGPRATGAGTVFEESQQGELSEPRR